MGGAGGCDTGVGGKEKQGSPRSVIIRIFQKVINA
jgi:hypothetical protein